MPDPDPRGLVLVVEDEPRHRRPRPAATCARDGFGVQVETDGAAALAAVGRLHPVAVVLDIGLPGMDGVEVCRRMRAADDWTPVLFVTARDDEVDRVVGLELGADDYVTKPFSPRELVARVRAVLRRAGRVARPRGRCWRCGPVRVSGRPRGAAAHVGDRRGRADRDRVRRCWRTSCARPGRVFTARAAAGRGLGLRGGGRHPHRRRPRRPAARQARRRQPHPDGARRRLRRGVAVSTERASQALRD